MTKTSKEHVKALHEAYTRGRSDEAKTCKGCTEEAYKKGFIDGGLAKEV